MNFKSIQILAFLALVALFTSCKKPEDKGGGAIKGSCKISAVTGYFGSPVSFLYDSTGRVDTMVAAGFFRTYKYEAEKVTISTPKNNKFDTRATLTYNKYTKLLDSVSVMDKDGNYEHRTYVYKNNNTVMEYIFTNSSIDSITYIWTGGNMTNMHPSNGVSPAGSIKYYSSMAFQEGDFNYMNKFIEKGYVPVGKTANLVQANYSGNINYKFNSNGYIKQVSSVFEGYPTVNYTYEYSCK